MLYAPPVKKSGYATDCVKMTHATTMRSSSEDIPKNVDCSFFTCNRNIQKACLEGVSRAKWYLSAFWSAISVCRDVTVTVSFNNVWRTHTTIVCCVYCVIIKFQVFCTCNMRIQSESPIYWYSSMLILLWEFCGCLSENCNFLPNLLFWPTTTLPAANSFLRNCIARYFSEKKIDCGRPMLLSRPVTVRPIPSHFEHWLGSLQLVGKHQKR